MKNRIALYIVPDISKVSGGPRTRISNFKKIFIDLDLQVTQTPLSKLKSIYSIDCNNIYVESSTNRIGLVDLMVLSLMYFKRKNIVVFIRDIYPEIFPEEYTGFRSSITKFFNRLTNWFYSKIAVCLAFPTLEMGTEFLNHYQFSGKIIDLPPCSTNVSNSIEDLTDDELSNRIVNGDIFYLGGTKYKYSGFRDFLSLRHSLSERIVVLSNERLDLDVRNYNFSYTEMQHYICKECLFMIHSRPLNFYDDITFPIKIFDCVSLKIPFITLRHKPLVRVLGDDYPFFVNEIRNEDILNILDRVDLNSYKRAIEILNLASKKYTYFESLNRIDQIL